jgi:peptide/nickel transport system substrate-binding protein
VARPLALAAALAVALLAVSGAGGAATQQTPKRGGTVVVGTYFEPACLNAYLERCGSSQPWVRILSSLSLRGAFSIGRDSTSYEPDLVTGVDVTRTPPFTLTYHIRREARWSDGAPITARDFVFTYNAIRSVMAEVWEPDAENYATVKSVRAVDAKTVRVVLRSRSARWRGLFPHVLPAHALRGEDMSRVFTDRITNPKNGRPIGSGPFLVQRWEHGRAVNFIRNGRFWKHPSHLDRIVVRFTQSGALAAEQVEWMRTGELDVLSTNALTGEDIGELRRLPGVTTRAVPGPSWEHLDIRVNPPGGHPLLRRKAVRRALAYGIDRVAIARMLFGQAAADYPPSDSVVYPVTSRYYQPNWRQYRYRPIEVRRLLEREGCRRGAGGIYDCQGNRLSLRIATTAGIPRREQTLEAIQRQLRRVGIEIVPVYLPGPVLFNQVFASGDFDLVLFSYLRFPDSPGTSAVNYSCGGVQNIAAYCQRLVTRDLDQATRILDANQQARVLNRADAKLARDVPVLPLYHVPTTIAYSARVRGVGIPAFFDPFVNAENWWLAEPR